jgi:glutamate-1-semialdehyde 2,1-aminomutase
MTAIATAAPTLVEHYQTKFPSSRRLAEEARAVFPHGVTHDLRHLEPFPVYIDHGQGAYKWDVDGHRLIDYWGGHGALLLGHSHPDIVQAVQQQVSRATHPGGCHALELQWGRIVQDLIPSAERVRFVSSGTEATMMALRLARIFTGKPKVLKFQGHFHGWNDYLAPWADPPYDNRNFPGIPAEVVANTVAIPPNDPARVERTLQEDSEIGCVILEPTGGRWGTVPIGGEFLRSLRDITRAHDRLLIFDEVITGFRVHPGGAQGHYGVTPDLTTLAKVLAGGLPGGAVAGREDILAGLEHRPGKPKMAHPGTFNANPLSAAAGVAALRLVSRGEPCRHANAMGQSLRQKLNALFAERGWDWIAYGQFSGCRLLAHYHGPRPTSAEFVPYDGDREKLDRPKDLRLIHAFRLATLLHGVDFMGLSAMLTAAHTEQDIEQTVRAVEQAIELLDQEKAI